MGHIDHSDSFTAWAWQELCKMPPAVKVTYVLAGISGLMMMASLFIEALQFKAYYFSALIILLIGSTITPLAFYYVKLRDKTKQRHNRL